MLVKRYKDIRDYYKSITTEYLDATFVKNHDQTRLLSELKGDINKARMAASLLLTMPGTPYLYYGEEIGMVGDKLQVYADLFGPDAYVREPFIWDEDKNDPMQTSWEKARYSTDSTVVPFVKQDNDPSSLLNFYRKLIRFRNTSKALTYGDIEQVELQTNQVVGFTRQHEDEKMLVLHNIADVEITIPLEGGNKDFSDIAYDMNGNTKLTDVGIVLSAYSTVILK
jgi:alpha-amylase